MSIKSAPSYWLVCDAPNCEAKSIVVMAEASEWKIVKGTNSDVLAPLVAVATLHYCQEHGNYVCRKCDAYDDTMYAGERDYLCVDCAREEGIHQCLSCGYGDGMHDRTCEAAPVPRLHL